MRLSDRNGIDYLGTYLAILFLENTRLSVFLSEVFVFNLMVFEKHDFLLKYDNFYDWRFLRYYVKKFC